MARSAFSPILVALACLGPAAAGAQSAASGVESPAVVALPTVGGAVEERTRLELLRGERAAPGTLLRSPSAALPAPEGGVRAWVVAPEVLLGWNSRIPFSLNEGALWSGRGISARAMLGAALEAGPVRLVLAPELVHTANAAFDSLVPSSWRERGRFHPDWQSGEHSIDLPYRMGDRARTELYGGQSSLTLHAGPVALGAATESHWWGPGIRNALVLSNQAPGFRHLFVRTARPLRTPIGAVEGRWIAGTLRDTEWFAGDEAAPETRALSAAAVVVTPWDELSLGVARSVHAPGGLASGLPFGAADVLTRWRPERVPASRRRFEQITSLFARAALPRSGAEVYAEWARTRLPRGVRELLEAPEHTQGYTLGLQWLRPVGGADLRLQVEHTYVEEAATWAWRQGGSWYASEIIPQGYTHRGQVLGAAVGPGGSGQWLAADWLRGGGRGGAFVGRIRWADDAYFDQPGGPNLYLSHDVSLFGGVRAALPAGPLRLDVEYAVERRWNLYFQNDAANFLDRQRAVNVNNHTLRLRATAGAPRLGPLR